MRSDFDKITMIMIIIKKCRALERKRRGFFFFLRSTVQTLLRPIKHVDTLIFSFILSVLRFLASLYYTEGFRQRVKRVSHLEQILLSMFRIIALFILRHSHSRMSAASLSTYQSTIDDGVCSSFCG